MIQKYLLPVVTAVLAASLTGCGGPDVDAPIEKSPYAPTQAQLDELTKSAMPKLGKVHGKVNAKKTQ